MYEDFTGIYIAAGIVFFVINTLIAFAMTRKFLVAGLWLALSANLAVNIAVVFVVGGVYSLQLLLSLMGPFGFMYGIFIALHALIPAVIAAASACLFVSLLRVGPLPTNPVLDASTNLPNKERVPTTAA